MKIKLQFKGGKGSGHHGHGGRPGQIGGSSSGGSGGGSSSTVKNVVSHIGKLAPSVGLISSDAHKTLLRVTESQERLIMSSLIKKYPDQLVQLHNGGWKNVEEGWRVTSAPSTVGDWFNLSIYAS